MVTSVVTFFPQSDLAAAYQVEYQHEPNVAIPTFIAEGPGGEIVDLSTDRWWKSLDEMAESLGVKLVGFVEDSGN